MISQRHRNLAWIDIYPLNKREVIVQDDGRELKPQKELSDFALELWKPKAEKGWKSSWIPFAKDLLVPTRSSKDPLIVSASSMPYYLVEGINNAIEENKSFAFQRGYNPCLSVGFLTATNDGKVIFQRRPENVHCPNILIHEPCGYMTSMAFSPRAECDSPKYARDPRLFELKTQLDFRKKEIAETFGVEQESVSYDILQDFLACGWKTIEMYFSTTGKIDIPEKGLKRPEKQEVFFVPFEDLKELIYAQGRLSQIDSKGYRPSNPKDIPLIDESLAGLIWGYEALTREKLDVPETVERLNREGMRIRIFDTSSGKTHAFNEINK